MNRKITTLALVLAAAGGLTCAGAAYADDITVDPTPFVSSRSRAEVRAELEAYRKSGVNPWARNYDPLRQFHSSRSRAEVTAEYIRDRDIVAAMNSEDSGSHYLAEARGRADAETRFAGRRSRGSVQQ